MTQKITNEMYPMTLKAGVDIEYFVRKSNWGFSFQLMEDDNVTPITTTGWTFELEIKESVNGEVYTTLTHGSGITMTAATGLFVIDVDDSLVDAYTFQTAFCKGIMTDDLGYKKVYFIFDNKFVA